VSIPALKRGASAPVKETPREKTFLAKLDKTLKAVPKGTFANVGGALGSKFGPIGAGIGRMAGKGLSAITGYGDYQVSSNTVSTVSASVDMVPQFTRNEHSIRVKHREYIRDLLVPSNPQNFTLFDYVINPGNRDLFPWLGQMARQYSQYKVHGMVFAYKTMSSDYAASGPLGTVFMATNYNAVDRPFANKLELENCEYAVSCKPSTSLVHAIECDPKVTGNEILYVRDPAYDTGEFNDRRFYDYGRFQVGTQGLPGSSGTTLGELWVTYDIELIKPIVGGSYIQGISLVSQTNGNTAIGVTSTIPALRASMSGFSPAVSTSYNLMPTNAATLSGDTAQWGVTWVTDANGNLKFLKNGRFRVVVGGTATVSSGLTLLNINTATAITPTVTKTGGAWYNALTAADQPSSFQNFGSLIPAIVVTNTPAANVPFYSCIFDFDIYGIKSVNDFVTLSLSNMATNNTGLVTNWIRYVDVEWSAYGATEQLSAFVPIDWPKP